MKRSRYLLVAATLAMATATVPVAEAAPQLVFNAPGDIAAIKQLEHALAYELDIDKVMSLYADNAVVLDWLSPGVYQGKAQIRAGIAPQLAGAKSVKAAVPEVTIATDGEFACAASQIAFDAVMKDGSTAKLTVRELDGLKKIDGHWRIVQQQISLPVDPATMVAQTNAPIQPRTLVWPAHPLAPISTTPEQAKLEIRQFMDVGGASVGLEQMMRFYGPGDDVLVYDALSPKALIGRKEIAAFYAPMVSNVTGVSLTMPIFAADSDGSFGLQIDTQHLVVVLKDGSKRNIALRESDCLRRVDGRWYTFMNMASYLVDAKTLKAQTTY